MYAEVVLPLPLTQSFHYTVPPALAHDVRVGSRILVPFGRRTLTGYIIKLRQKKPSPGFEFKDIKEVLDPYPVFSSRFLTFTRKLSEYSYSSWGELLQASLPPSFDVHSQTRFLLVDSTGKLAEGHDLRREESEILKLLERDAYTEIYLRRSLKHADVDVSRLLQRLLRLGLIVKVQEIERDLPRWMQAESPSATQLEMDFSLDPETARLVEPLRSKLRKRAFSSHLLQLPAAKRRAAYLSLLRECLSLGRRVLYLTPEILLSQDFLADIEGKMVGRAALLHSRLSKAQRELLWRRIKRREVDVVLGPRSALLSPLEGVGLVIVDEEQAESFYQRENPAYEARWGARLRAQQESAMLVLGSAWPSVETYFRSRKRGSWLGIESRAVSGQTSILDDRTFRSVIAAKILNRIRRRLTAREGIVVFCSRRGYAAMLACSRCPFTPRCRRCDVAMSFHKKEGRLVCHYCNATEIPSSSCPRCGSKIVATRGPGIEVISEELRRNFPEHRMESFDKDEAGKKSEQDAILSRFQNGETEILVGTPLLAHRVDLVPVSMVVIFNPEVFLGMSDFQAAQKTYQNMRRMMAFLQDTRSSELIVQTSFPEHHSILAAVFGDYRDFYRQELRYRQVMNYPPFSCMAEVVFQDESLRTAARRSREFISRLENVENSPSFEILGPARAPLSKLRGKNRVQVFVKAGNKKKLDAVLREAWESSRGRRSIFIYE